ncbi:MAG: FHA domain-containing protein [Chloroflexi bacterium]|nr:FHA domain-containing protein [Chloroflexota bacterium]
MDDFIDVKIDVFEHTGQRARLRRSLTVLSLIGEILKEFDDITADSPEKYAIYLKGFDHPLKPAGTLAELDIQPQDELVFDYVRQSIRRMLDVRNYATLREDITGKEFDIQWQPAVIGRPSTDVDHNIILAVNVQLLPNGNTISRRHAQITFADGSHFIEPLAEQNKVYLNGKELPVHSRREIRNGDKLAFGNNKLTLTFSTQSQQASHSVAREPAVQTPARPAASTPAPSKPLQQPFVPPAMDKDATNFVASTSAAALIVEASSSLKAGTRIDMLTFPFILGRSLEILGVENEISRRHAVITHDNQRNAYFITDLQSTNGVTINGKKIPPNVAQAISPGMHIGLGRVFVARFEVLAGLKK